MKFAHSTRKSSDGAYKLKKHPQTLKKVETCFETQNFPCEKDR